MTLKLLVREFENPLTMMRRCGELAEINELREMQTLGSQENQQDELVVVKSETDGSASSLSLSNFDDDDKVSSISKPGIFFDRGETLKALRFD